MLIGGLSSLVRKKGQQKERKKKIKTKKKKGTIKKNSIEGGKFKTDRNKERKMHRFRTES